MKILPIRKLLAIILGASVVLTHTVYAQEELLISRSLSQGTLKSAVNTTGVPVGDLQKITWSKLSNLGPGNQAAGPSNVTPPILTGSSGNYWVGRLCNGVGQVAIPGGVRTSDYKDLRLKITWAAAGDVNGTQNTFTSGAQYIRIEGVAGGVPTGPFGGRRANIVDTFVGNATGLLKGNKSGQTIGTTFGVTELNLDTLFNVAPGVITEFGRMIITARTGCDQVMGIDKIEIWGTPKDQCPDDPNKTEPGLCGCGIPDDTPLCLYNSDFQLGDLTNWTSSSFGQTSVVTEPAGSLNYAGQMITGPGSGSGDAVRLTIPVNTPDEGFYIQFDAKFLATEGNLDIAISGVPVMTLAAPLQADSALTTYTVFVGDESLRNLNLEDYSFTYHANSGATLLLDNVAIVPQSAMNECYYDGDPIGTQASWEGIATKGIRGTLGGSKPYWQWDFNSGHTGILFHADGLSTLSQLSAIGTLGWPSNPTRAFHYPCSLWTVDIWPLQDYLNQAPPMLTVNLGVEPDNWSGFVTLPSGSVVPNTNIFANSGPTFNWDGYQYIWNLSQPFFTEWSHSQATILDPWGHGSETFTPFSTPLPIGDYIIGFQARGDTTNCGWSAILRDSNRGVGPTAYYSSISTLPQPIVPGLDSNPNYRYALALKATGPVCN